MLSGIVTLTMFTYTDIFNCHNVCSDTDIAPVLSGFFPRSRVRWTIYSVNHATGSSLDGGSDGSFVSSAWGL